MVRKKILVCSELMPEFDRESGSRRIYDLIELLREADWDVTFVAQHAPNGDHYARLLRQQGVAVYIGFNADTDRMIAKSGFDVALIAYWHIAEQHVPVIRRISPKTRIIVDSIDLHFMRNARGIFKLGSTSGARILDNGFARELIREVNTYAAADGVLTVSQKEADLVNDLIGDPTLAFAVPDCEEMAASDVPFDERKGILFFGNFRHVSSVGAAEFLCREIAPRLDAELVKKHPLYIVGNDLDDKILALGRGLPNVHMVGWVPSVLPYLERTRVTVIPNLYDAGTKRNMIQALMVGTPTVSTTIGVEGLNLCNEKNVMIADEPGKFAEGVNRLLVDKELWERVAREGSQHICASYCREGAKARLLETLTAVLAKKPKSKELAYPALDQHLSRINDHYSQLMPRIRKVVEATLPAIARVLVVSRGDDELINLEGRQGWHFPQNENGVYAGHHPADSAAAIAQLEALRRKGAEYLLLPSSAFWWLDHYVEFKLHLDSSCELFISNEDCIIYFISCKKSAVCDYAASDPSFIEFSEEDRSWNGVAKFSPGAIGGIVDVGQHTSIASVYPMVGTDSPHSQGLLRLPDGSMASNSAQSVDIVVCVHNALADVKRCLESIQQHGSWKHSLILVDDGSNEETRDFLKQFAHVNAAKLLRNEIAKGYTFAANQGLLASHAAYVILLNSDTVVSPNWMERMLACAESDPRIGLVGPLSNTASWQSIPELSHNGDWADNPLPEGVSVAEMGTLVAQTSGRLYPRFPFLNGFCLMLKRQVINDLGYFDEVAFGRGYGEENDYCLRAQKAGWQLAVADDAYVYHRQSRSYSNDRRKELCDHAGRALQAKHGQRLIDEGVNVCKSSRVLKGIRARARAMFERRHLRMVGSNFWKGKRVLFVLPTNESGGGSNVVLQESIAMRQMGVDVALLNFTRNRIGFSKAYPTNSIPIFYANNEAEVAGYCEPFDAVVATWNKSVDWLAVSGLHSRLVRGYYIQDFEPYFFADGSTDFHVALRSYTRYPDLVRFTKTEWNRAIVIEKTGVNCNVVGPSVDIDLFRPRPRRRLEAPGEPVRIAAMIRPSSPRRAPELTMEVLREIARTYKERVEIVIFGCPTVDIRTAGLPDDFAWKNAGILNPAQTALFLNEADIFVDFSTFQAMGLTALEAMACGLAVIVPKAGGASSFANDRANCLVVDTQSKTDCRKALELLVNDVALRADLQDRAAENACAHSPEKAAFNILSVLFPQIPASA